jgi:hypothetical protein
MRHRLLAALAAASLAAALAPACSSGSDTAATTSSSTEASSSTTASGGAGGAAPDPGALCATLGLTRRAFAAGPYGEHRGEVADDFTLDLTDGTSFHLKERFSGCDSYVFVTDSLPVSEADATSVWKNQVDLRALLKASPKNVHYFFVTRRSADADAQAEIALIGGNIAAALGKLSADDAAHWKERLHVAAKKGADLDGWIGEALSTHGKIGFAIDRLQRVRGAGDLSDVTRQDASLNAQGKWPFKRNLAYVAHDPRRFDAESDLAERLDAEGATVIDLWKGEVLMEKADTTVTLPSAAEMASFDTLEVEVWQSCPDAEEIELGNCGAWDYLANLFLTDDAATPVEVARFITSYHRETHWVVDASALLPRLATGGPHAFQWSFAPSWNTQPTGTKLSLRLSNQKKGAMPTEAHDLFTGGDFNAAYNAGRAPVTVPIPASAQKVELFVIVTGHGSDPHQCAEFCDHQHVFTVNGHDHAHDFPMAGTEDQCMPNLTHGMTPNQAGTWWYGRGGWCPGQQVDPWIVDVTAEVTPGEDATIAYRGLFQGADPPADGGGNISMTSYLVVHE